MKTDVILRLPFTNRGKTSLRRRIALLATCAGILVLPQDQVAWAQQSGEIAAAEEAASSGSGVDELFVTARRREELLQKVPISVTALSQEVLTRNAIKSLEHLQYLVPSMSVTGGNDGRSHPRVSLRGVNGRVTDGQAVVTYLNEVALPPGPQNETGGGMGLLYDLESLQVLKGPQGTLFGKNAIGGAILYETKRPTNELEGFLEGTLGKYDNREITGAINVPIIDDTILVRAAFNGAKRDGFTESLGTANHPDGVDLDDRDYFAGRLTTTFRLSSAIQNDVIFDNINEVTNGTSQILTGVSPDGFAILLFPDVVDALATQRALGPRTQLPTNTPSWSKTQFTSVTDIFRWDISESLTFRNIASYNRVKSQFAGDWDGTEFPIISSAVGKNGELETPYQLQTYSEEAQLQGESLGKKLVWTFGALYQHNPKQPKFNLRGELFGGPIFGGGRLQTSTSIGIYAQGTYDLSALLEGLSFTAGYRYSKDKISLKEGDFEKIDFSTSSWTLGLDYQVTDDTLLYIASRRGYHAGGLNDIESTVPVPYDPEFVTDVEIGVKSDWTIGGANARTNLALYRSDYTDFQFEQVQLIGMDIATVFANAGEARVQGVEFESALYPIENLELTGQYAFLDFDYTKFEPGVDGERLERLILGNGPRHRYSLGARWDITPNNAFGGFSIWALWNWQSRTNIRYAEQEQPSYGLLNLGVDWNEIGGQPIDASFSMTNVLDKDYAVGGFSFLEGPLAAIGTETTVFGEPRMFNFRLRYRFGT